MFSGENVSRRRFLKSGALLLVPVAAMPVIQACQKDTSVLSPPPTRTALDKEIESLPKVRINPHSGNDVVQIPEDAVYSLKSGNHYVAVVLNRPKGYYLSMRKVQVSDKQGRMMSISGLQGHTDILFYPRQTIQHLKEVDITTLKRRFVR